MFQNLVGNFRKSVLDPAIDQKMGEVGRAWVAEASRLAPVDSGFLRSSLGFTYDTQKKALNLYADARYALFQEFGTRTTPAHPFMRPALSVVPRIWRGSIGHTLTGHSVALQAPNLAPKYHAKTLAFAGGKTRGARLMVGHGRFA